jgi:hypothetical protein
MAGRPADVADVGDCGRAIVKIQSDMLYGSYASCIPRSRSAGSSTASGFCW